MLKYDTISVSEGTDINTSDLCDNYVFILLLVISVNCYLYYTKNYLRNGNLLQIVSINEDYYYYFNKLFLRLCY